MSLGHEFSLEIDADGYRCTICDYFVSREAMKACGVTLKDLCALRCLSREARPEVKNGTEIHEGG